MGDFSVDSETGKIIVCGEDLILKVITKSTANGSTKEAIQMEDAPVELYCIDALQPGKKFVVAGDDNKASLMFLDNPSDHIQFIDFTGKVLDLEVTKDGSKVCIVGQNKNPLVYDFNEQKRQTFDSSETCNLLSCSWSPSGNLLSIVSAKGTLSLYQVTSSSFDLVKSWKITEKEIKSLPLHSPSTSWIDDSTFLCSGKDCLQIISNQSGAWTLSVSTTIKQDEPIYCVKHLRGPFICTVSQSNKLSIWNYSLELLMDTKVLSNEVCRLRFLPENDTLYALDSKGFFHTIERCISSNAQVAAVSKPLPVEMDKEEPHNDHSNKAMDAETAPVRDILQDSGSAAPAAYADVEDEEHQSAFKQRKQMQLIDEIEEEEKAVIQEEEQRRVLPQENGNRFYSKPENPAQQKHRKIIESYLTEEPQKLTRFGGTSGTKRCYLCCNMAGKVEARTQGEDTRLIDIEYANSELQKKTVINNCNYTMASLHNVGTLLASTGYFRSEDEYENEELEDEQKLAVVSFFSSQTNKNWTIKMPKDENILSIVQGNYFSAVYTNTKMIKLINPAGKVYMVFAMPSHVIGLAAYENLLAVLYVDSFPFSGCQQIKVRALNVSNLHVQFDTPVPVSTKAKAKWFGFSEEGLIFVQDTQYMVWGMINESVFVPFYDGGVQKNMWILGIFESSIVSYKLPYGEHEPNPLVNFNPTSTKFVLPGIDASLQAAALASMRTEQEAFRTGLWGHMKTSHFEQMGIDLAKDREPNRMTLKTQEDIEKLILEDDKQRVDMVRKAALEDNLDEAISIGLQLRSTRTLEICLKMLEKINKPKLALRLKLEAEMSGAFQYTSRTSGNTVFIPQLVVKETQSAATEKQPFQECSINSVKMNSVSFKEILTEEFTPKPVADKSGENTNKFGDDGKQKKKSGLDLFKDLSDLAKLKK